MGIAKIKKLELIGLQKDKEEILRLLQKLGGIQLIDIRSKEAELGRAPVYSDVKLLEIEEAISYLASFKKERARLGGIVRFKPLVYAQQVQEVISQFDYQDILKELAHLRQQLRIISEHKEKLLQEKHLLLPWHRLALTLEEIHYKEHCGIILGILNRRDYTGLSEDLEKNKINLFIETAYEDKVNLYLVIFYLQDDFERLEALLKNYYFNFVTLPHHKCRVDERLFEINREISYLDDQIAQAKDKIVGLANQQFKLMVVYDYLYNLQKAQASDESLAKQEFTFTLAGWFRAQDEKLLTQAISKSFKNVALFILEPRIDEVVPVILENKPILQPFEFITAIYGMPKYHEIDPTPFLAPFFFLYFGFCVSDVGYGLILICLCWFILKKFRLGLQGKKFFKLFLFCGISTIIIGALTGSWFGNLFDLAAESNKIFLPLKRFKDTILVLDPLKQPTRLLAIALCFGIIQVWFGNIVAAIGNLKNKRYLDILWDQVSMLTFLFGLTGLGLIFLKLINSRHLVLFKPASLLGAVALILTQGRLEKGMGAKLFYGVYNLYNAFSGYLSDILSYSRLWALGLVTGVMANTINLISIQFSQILISVIPFINRISFLRIIISGIILVVIFVLGHIVSFLMNLLGAFVHPLRLQFVEFFSKFFKAGGSALKPFKIETKYIDFS